MFAETVNFDIALVYYQQCRKDNLYRKKGNEQLTASHPRIVVKTFCNPAEVTLQFSCHSFVDMVMVQKIITKFERFELFKIFSSRGAKGAARVI